MRFKAWLAVLIASIAISACIEKPQTGQTASGLWYSDTVEVPVHIIFVKNGTTSSGEPSTTEVVDGVVTAVTTPRTVDEDIEAFNYILLNAATDGGTGRRIRLRRVSTTILDWPSVTIAGSSDWNQFNPYFRSGMVNVVVCNHNAGGSGFTNAQWNRAHVRWGGSMQHELGHLLDLRHPFTPGGDGEEDNAYSELLHRELDASVPTSCYRRGDRVCDTPPDYGWATESAVDSGVFTAAGTFACDQPGLPDCAQTTAVPCTSSESSMVRRTALVGPSLMTQPNFCQSLGGGSYRRVYDPVLYNHVVYPTPPNPPPPRNLMMYNYPSYLTPGQFHRAWGYSRWTLNEMYAVPEADKDILWDFYGHYGRFGNGATPGRVNHRVSRIEVPLALSPTGTLASGQNYSFSPSLSHSSLGDGRALLGFELLATKTGGTLPNNTFARVDIPSPQNPPLQGISQTLRLEESGLVLRSQYFKQSSSQYSIGSEGRGSLGSAVGNWQVTINMPSGSSVSYSDLRLVLYLADRGSVTNSFYNRGVSDVLVYRPTNRQLWSSLADTAWSAVYGYGSQTTLSLSSTADCDAFLVAGNFDSDSTLDVICNAPNTSNIQPSGLFTGWKSLAADGTVTGIGSITRSQSNTMIAGDFDSDFLDDLLLGPGTNISSGGWAVYRNEGNRAFAGPVTVTFDGYSAPRRPNATTFSSDTTWTVGDFDGDGLADLMVREASGSYGVMYFYRSLGLTSASSYGFAAPQQITVGGGSTAFYFTDDDMTAFDATGDGADDLVFRRKSTGEWWISNSPGPRFSTASFSGGWRAQIGGQYSGNYLSTDRVIGSSR